jgi:hypothetical protein
MILKIRPYSYIIYYMQGQRPQAGEAEPRFINVPNERAIFKSMAAGGGTGFVAGLLIVRHIDGRQKEGRQEIKLLRDENNGIRLLSTDDTVTGQRKLTTNQEEIKQLESSIPDPPPGHDIGILAVMTFGVLVVGGYVGNFIGDKRLQRLLPGRST